MNFVMDPDGFEKQQTILVEELMQKIRIKLVEAGLQGEDLAEATAAIAHSVTTTIDDLAGVESDGVAVRPYLCFRTEDDEVIHCGENSYTNEFVYSTSKKMF